MSCPKYIDVHSTFRDRNRFPDPSTFVVTLAQTGRRTTAFSARDAISLSTPVFPLFSSAETAFAYTSASGSQTYRVDGIVEVSNGAAERIYPFSSSGQYTGFVFEDVASGSFATITATEISETGTQYDAGTVLSATSDAIALGAVSLPFTAHSDIDNYYVGYRVEIGGQSRVITQSFGSDPSFAGNPSVYVSPPWEGDPATLVGASYSIVSAETYFVTVDTVLSILTVPPATTGSQRVYRIRPEKPHLVGTLVSATATTFELPSFASAVDEAYAGWFIWLPGNGAHLILAYNGATRTGLVSGFDTTPSPGDSFNILAFSRDNLTPLVYNGSFMPQQPGYYEIELVNITVPNALLLSSYGSRTSFLPYLFIEFYNASSPLAAPTYSNDPVSCKSLFKVPVFGVDSPLAAPFVVLQGNGMRQVMLFRPNGDLVFSILLPNGEPFRTQLSDWTSPAPPNPLVQISATFAVRRLEDLVTDSSISF